MSHDSLENCVFSACELSLVCFFYMGLVQKREERMWLFIVFCRSGCHLPRIHTHRHQNTVLWWWFKDLQCSHRKKHGFMNRSTCCTLSVKTSPIYQLHFLFFIFWNLFQITRSWRERPGFAVSWNTRILVMDSVFPETFYQRSVLPNGN